MKSIFIILLLISGSCFSQQQGASGYVLQNTDGTLRIKQNTILIPQVKDLQKSLASKDSLITILQKENKAQQKEIEDLKARVDKLEKKGNQGNGNNN